MKHQLSLTLVLCMSALATACGDDSGSSPTPPADEPDAATSSDTSAPAPTDTAAVSTSDDNSSASSDEDASTSSFVIESPNFDDEAPLPEKYTCEGKAFGDGQSPELNWSGAPAGTKSYALVFKDLSLLPDLPIYAYHWAAWNIPVSVTGIPEHLGSGEQPAELEGGSQFRAGPAHDVEFFGPCPSWTTLCEGAARVTDHYSFTLYAFDVEELEVPAPEEGLNYAAQLGDYFASLAIAETEVNATSDAVPTSAPMCPADSGVVAPSDAAVSDGGDSVAPTDAAVESDGGDVLTPNDAAVVTPSDDAATDAG